MSQAMSELSNEIVNTRKKITLATFKSWMRKNEGKILINVKSSFDGITDGCESRNGGFVPLSKVTVGYCSDNNLGFSGVWLVFGGRDYFTSYEDFNHIGIATSNCCGRFILAVKKQAGSDETETPVQMGWVGKDGQP